MKKMCIFLIKLKRGYLFLTVMLFGLIVFSLVGNVDKMMPKINGLFASVVLLVFLIAQTITQHFFYSDEELKEQEMNGNIVTNTGFIVSDKYFQIKINTKLSFSKRICGYIYVIVGKLIGFVGFYFISVVFCGLIEKLWAG